MRTHAHARTHIAEHMRAHAYAHEHISYRTLPYRTLPYLTLPYLTLPYTLFRVVLCCISGAQGGGKGANTPHAHFDGPGKA